MQLHGNAGPAAASHNPELFPGKRTGVIVALGNADFDTQPRVTG